MTNLKGPFKNFACVCYGDKYSLEYVQKLYNMVQRNTTYLHNFYCFTDNVKAHKILATIHFSGMVATNYFSKKNTDFHKYSAYTTFASYFAAVVVFKFK